MRYPKFLKKNGTIGFVAPSFGCNIEPYKSAFNHAQKKFRQMGYRLELGSNCYKGEGIGISNTPKLCAEEFMDGYCREESDILISCGGGELMCEDLDYVDFERLRKAEPKWFMGYSDNTNFTYLRQLFVIPLRYMVHVQLPLVWSLGMNLWMMHLEFLLERRMKFSDMKVGKRNL